MRYINSIKKETRFFKDILIILTSVSIFMLATVLESCSFETVDVFSSSQNNDSVPVSDDNMPSPKSRQTETSTATVTPTPSTSTVRSWPSHEFFENVLRKAGTDAKNQTTPLPVMGSTFLNTKRSVTEASNLTETIRNLTMRHEDQFNHSVLITTRQTPVEYENGTNSTEASIRTLNMTDDKTRSQLSREWKLGFDISIVGAENTSETNNYFSKEALHSRDALTSRAPSSVVTKAEIPLRIIAHPNRKKIKPNNQTEFQPNLYAKVSGSYNFGHDGKTIWETRNKTTNSKIKTQADYVDDEDSNPYGWIDNIGDITSPPLKNVPKFPVAIWPYTQKSTSGTTVFPFSIIKPKVNSTGKATTAKPIIIRSSTTEKMTPAVEPTAKPIQSGPTTTWTQIPVLIVENAQKHKINSQHWGSSGTTAPPIKEILTSKPLRVKTRATTKRSIKITSTTTTTEFPEEEKNPAEEFVDALFSVVSEKPEIQMVVTTRAPTNIWYKPVINHYSFSNISTTYGPISPVTTTPQYSDGNLSVENAQQIIEKNEDLVQLNAFTTEATTKTKPTTKSGLKYKIKTANSKEKIIIFKIWNYVNGKLELQTQREIPSWILKNYNIKDGDILNLQQLPPEIKDLVKSTIQSGREEGKENRTEREQFHWQELPSVSPDAEFDNGDGSIEKTNPTSFPSWMTDVSTEWKNPISLNYVVLNKTKLPSYILNHGSSAEETNYQQYLQEYLHYATTPTPATSKSPENVETYLSNLKTQQNLNRLQQLIIDFMATTPTPVVKDSHPWDKIQDHDLMANLASFAIIMTHLRDQYPQQPLYSPPNTTPNPYGFTPPARDHFWAAMYPLLQHLLNNKNFTFIPPSTSQLNQVPQFYIPTLPPVKYPQTSATEATRFNDQAYTTTPISNIDTDEDNSENESYDDEYDLLNNEEELNDKTGLTKTLLTKAVKGIKAIKAIKGLKKAFKKKGKKKGKKGQYSGFNPSKLGILKPGTYDFQFELFGGGLMEVIRKKLTALVAIKYMPVALVLAFGLLPISIVFIPFLFKYLKLKLAARSKKPKKIYVPVPIPQYVPYPQPYPEPYPVHHQPVQYGWPSPAYGVPYDNYYAGDNTGYNADADELKGDKEEIDHHYLDQSDGLGWPVDTAAHSPPANPHYADSYVNEEAEENIGAKGYQLGHHVGAAIGKIKQSVESLPIPTLDNKHDSEVLKILINNKKDMIKKLLRKWKLTNAKFSPYVPPLDGTDTEEYIENQYHQRRRRRRRK